MADDKQERAKAIEAALAQIDKQFGKGSIMRLGSREKIDVPAIPTGSLSLDAALGGGGMPRGRDVEIFGPESSGKTTLALHVIAEAQRRGGICAFIDSEHAMEPSYARRIGVNIDDLLVSQPDTRAGSRDRGAARALRRPRRRRRGLGRGPHPMIWVGFWGGGLAIRNTINSNVYHWRNEKDNFSSLSHNDIWALHKDSRGRLWIGTNGGGLNLYNSEKPNSFYHWNSSNKNKKTLSSNNIYTICESVSDSKAGDQTILWIGTANGLNKFIINNDSGSSDGSKMDVEIKYYTVDNGLPDNAIESILEDESGNLWIGTSTGISGCR